MFAEVKFSLEMCRKGETKEVWKNKIKVYIYIYIYIYIKQSMQLNAILLIYLFSDFQNKTFSYGL